MTGARPTGCPETATIRHAVVLAEHDPERVACVAHVRTCTRCRPLWDQAEAELAPLSSFDASAAPAAIERVRANVHAALSLDASKVRREGWLAIAAAALAIAVAFWMFRVSVGGILPLVELALATVVGVAIALTADNRHRARLGLAVAACTSAVLVALNVDGSLEPAAHHGQYCASIVVITGVVPALVAGALSLSSIEPSRGWRNAARTAATALIAQGVLVLLCDNHGLPHLLPYHVGAVVVAVMLGGVVPGALARLRRALA